jgi:hypothetical protein
MMIRSIVTALATALILTCSGPASAEQAKCIAGKTKCMSTKAGGLLKCEETAETPGKPADQSACRAKVVAKFDGGADPTKGCFEKLENKNGNDCLTFGDTPAAEAAVDSCVGSFVAAIDPSATQTKCGAGKKKCVAKYLGALLKCAGTAQTPGKPADQSACIAKATAKYNGGADPTKGCFAKLEAKKGNDCAAPLDNSDTLQGLVGDCVDNLSALVTNTTTTTTTVVTTTTTTTLPFVGTVLAGALPATAGRFNYNLTLGLPGATAACHSTWGPAAHLCTYAELQSAQTAGDLVGLMDTAGMMVTSFWAIDSTQPALQQCNDDVVSGLNWEYATAHTTSRGERVALTNGTGVLGPLQMGVQCNISGTSSVGCCH